MYPYKNKNQLIIEAMKRDPEIIFFGPRPSILVNTPPRLNIEMYKDLLASNGFHQRSSPPSQNNLK